MSAETASRGKAEKKTLLRNKSGFVADKGKAIDFCIRPACAAFHRNVFLRLDGELVIRPRLHGTYGITLGDMAAAVGTTVESEHYQHHAQRQSLFPQQP
mgnify:CR=1 FL=1